MQSNKESSDLAKKAVKGVVWSVLQTWGGQVISFIVFFFLARLLGPETFGLVALASIFLAFVEVFLDQGFSQAIIQRRELEPEHLDTAFWINILIASFLTILSIIVSGLFANFYNEPQLTPIIRWLSLTFVFSGLSSVQQAIFTRKLAFKTIALRSFVAMLAGGLVGVTMAFMGFGVWSLVGQQLTRGLAKVLVLWWVSDWRPGFKVSVKHFRELFSFGISILGIKLFDFFNRRSDDFLIGYYLGPTALGYYTVAYKLLLIMTQLLISVIDRVAMTTFSRIQDDTERLRRAYYTATQLTSLFAFPAFLGVAALAPELVNTLFGKQWLPSIPVMQILAFIGILHSVYFFNGSLILAMGKPAWKLWLNCLNSITNVIGFMIAVPWGIVAVAAAYVIRGYLVSPIALVLIKKLIGISLKKYFSGYIASLTGSLIMVTVIFGTKYFLSGWINEYVLLAVCIIVGMLTYGIVIALIAPKLFQRIFNLVSSVIPVKKQKKV